MGKKLQVVRQTGVIAPMVRELRIKNLALIEDVSVEFNGGFSVFTGETGAGKSILVGAIGLLLGERASAEMVRGGTEEAEVSGVFEFRELKRPLAELLKENGVPVDDGSLILRRTIARNNRNRIFINQVPLPLSVLKKVGDALVDFHGQHEHQSLLNPETPRLIIDSLPAVTGPKHDFDAAYADYTAARDSLEAHDRTAGELAQKKEVIEFQHNELKTLDLKTNEEESLEEEIKLLSSTTQRVQCVSQIDSILTDPETPMGRQLGLIRKNLEALSRFDPSVNQWIADIETASSVFTELESFCGSYLEKTRSQADPGRLEFINGRLAKIQRLKKKYSCSCDQLIEKMNVFKKDLEALENSGADRSLLEKRLEKSLEQCMASGRKLGITRKKESLVFDKKVSGLMEKLGFTGGMWQTRYTDADGPQVFGLEDCAFAVRTNPGEEVLPLVKIASGGEISRLMLAIKTVMADQDNIPVLIFDEIDTGIGGMLAKEVGRSLVNLSKTHQLLCISHLHQIASLADHHFHVYKETRSGRTITSVKLLDDKEKVVEIARMLGGESAISKKHAEELLQGK
jgi:DNA repair protein RecN (Recombination protein N)